jgi:hypothetical protein
MVRGALRAAGGVPGGQPALGQVGVHRGGDTCGAPGEAVDGMAPAAVDLELVNVTSALFATF